MPNLENYGEELRALIEDTLMQDGNIKGERRTLKSKETNKMTGSSRRKWVEMQMKMCDGQG